MKLIRNIACCLVLMLLGKNDLKAQLYKIDLTHKINKATLIVEGKVIEQHSFWNDAHTVIYRSNKLHIYKLFKGKIISKEIEIITQGGTVGTQCLRVSDVVQLRTGMAGMFFLNENGLNIHSPFTGKVLYDVYSSDQGFLRYDKPAKVAWAPFAKYQNIQNDLYGALKRSAGVQEQIIDSSFKLSSGTVNNGASGGAIVSFSPASVHAGALNDPTNNILTINGSGFGSSPSNAAGVAFKDANDDSQDPNFKISYTSPYIISWSDTKITLNVPDSAATGKLAVILNDGTMITAATDLQVFFAVQDAEFDYQNKTFAKEPRLMNTNGSGGYTVQYGASTAGKGKDFSISTARPTFERALATWNEILGANIVIGSTTTVQKIADDSVNVVMFDNTNTGVPRMADGVLEATYSWYQVCTQSSTLLTAQKTGFDVLVRNDGVSTGSIIDFEDGPCFPVQGTYDLETIFLHELGHALNLSHINDDYQNNSNSYTTVNPAKLMHYSVLDYVDRRSPDIAAYQGALYTTKQQHNTYGNCGLYTSEMTLLSSTPAANDECPSTFPATELQDNTIVSFDLIHATSNKFGDPSFEQVTCDGKGTSVTNNLYYAFLTGTRTDITIDIKDYTTLPAALSSCSGQSLRLALYDVQSCPVGQSYPTPISCSSFSGNGTIKISNLEQNHKYLLYFDGVRNTKASFTAVFDSDSSSQPSGATVTVFPNPVTNTNLTIQIVNPSGTFYEYALFDAIGKLVSTGKISTPQTFQTYLITLNNIAAGVYFLRLVDDNGNAALKTKILKQH
jgi:hypothetical protein